jgi:hypothetical protein
MADTMRISYGGTNIDFSPGFGYDVPDDLGIIRFRTPNGTLYSYKFFYKYRWEVPVSWFNSSDTTNINSWWSNNYDVTFYPDRINSPGTSFTCKIVNGTRPISRFNGPYWETYYEGTLILEQT